MPAAPESGSQSSRQAQGIAPPVIIPRNIVSLGKHSLLYDNWIYTVVSRNAFVLKPLAKSNITCPRDKIHRGNRQELPGQVFKEKENRSQHFPSALMLIALPISREDLVAVGLLQRNRENRRHACVYFFLLRHWLLPLWRFSKL